MKNKHELDETRIADALMDDATRNVPVSVDVLPRVRGRLAQPRLRGISWRRLAPLGALACTVGLMGGAVAVSPRLQFLAQQAARAFWSAPATPDMEAAATTLPVTQPSATGGLISYTVQSGDTFYSLSKKFNAYPDTLAALNGMDAADRLSAGQTITVRNNPPPAPTVEPVPTIAPIILPAAPPITQTTTEPYELLRVRMNKGYANAVAWSPDGSAFAVASAFEVSVYDAATLRRIDWSPTPRMFSKLKLGGGPAALNKNEFAKGQTMSSGWRFWDPMQDFVMYEPVVLNKLSVLSEEGAWMATVLKSNEIEIYHRVPEQKLMHIGELRCSQDANGLRFSPDKRFFACLMPFGAALWNLQTQTRTDLYWTGKAQPDDKPLNGGDLAFSADSRRLAASGGAYASVWDVDTEVMVQNFAMFQPASRIRLNADGSRLAVLVEPQVNVYDVIRGRLLQSFEDWVSDFDLSPDGKQVLMGGNNGLRVIEVESKRLIGRVADYQVSGPGQTVFGPDGQHIVVSARQGSFAIDAATGHVQSLGAKYKEPFYALALSPDSRHVLGLLVDDTQPDYIFEVLGLVWVDVITGDEVKRFDATATRAISFASKVMVMPDGNAALFYGLVDGQWGLSQLDLNTGRVKQLIKGDWGGNYAISQDGRRAASFMAGQAPAQSSLIQVWNIPNRQPVMTRTVTISNERYPYVAMNLSTDGGVLAVSLPKLGLQVWHVETGKELLSLPVENVGWGFAVLSPNGTRIATIENSGAIAVWDVATAKRIHTFTGSLGWSWAFSPDSKKLVTQSGDGTLRVWRVE